MPFALGGNVNARVGSSRHGGGRCPGGRCCPLDVPDRGQVSSLAIAGARDAPVSTNSTPAQARQRRTDRSAGTRTIGAWHTSDRLCSTQGRGGCTCHVGCGDVILHRDCQQGWLRPASPVMAARRQPSSARHGFAPWNNLAGGCVRDQWATHRRRLGLLMRQGSKSEWRRDYSPTHMLFRR